MASAPAWPAYDDTVTIRPHVAVTMSDTEAWMQLNVPVRLTPIIRSQRSPVMSAKLRCAAIPAAVTTMSIGPKASRASATAASTETRSATSTWTAMVSLPLASRERAADPAPSPLMSSRATRSPRSASRWAIARPIPDAAPVTSAVLVIRIGVLVDLSVVGIAIPRPRSWSLSTHHLHSAGANR